MSQGQENLQAPTAVFRTTDSAPWRICSLLDVYGEPGENYAMDVSPTTTVAQKRADMSGTWWFHSSHPLHSSSLPSEAENCHLDGRWGCTATLHVADACERDVRVKGVTFTDTLILSCPGHLRKLSGC